MGGGHTVVVGKGRGNGPDQTLREYILVGLHPSAEFTVKRESCIGVCLKGGGEAFQHKRFSKASHKVAGDRLVFADLQKDSRSFGNAKLKSEDVDLLCEDRTLFLGLLCTIVCINGSDLAALAVKEGNLVLGKRIFSGQISAEEVWINLIANDPFEYSIKDNPDNECQSWKNLQIKRHFSIAFLYGVCYNKNSNKIKKERINK